MNQDMYIPKVLEKFGISDCKLRVTLRKQKKSTTVVIVILLIKKKISKISQLSN